MLSSFNFLFTTILLKGLHYQKSMRFHVLNYKIDYYNCGFFLKVKVTLFIKSLSLFFSFLAFSFNVHSYAFSLSLRSSLKNPCFIFLFFFMFFPCLNSPNSLLRKHLLSDPQRQVSGRILENLVCIHLC